MARAEPIPLPSGILINPAVWPQQTRAENSALCPFEGGAGSPSNTLWPGPRPSSLPIDILIHAAVWPQQTWATDYTDGLVPLHFESGGCCAHFRGESWVLICHNVASAEAYLHAKFHLDPSSRLATTHQRHRQTDNDGIGRTVLQTVAQLTCM